MKNKHLTLKNEKGSCGSFFLTVILLIAIAALLSYMDYGKWNEQQNKNVKTPPSAKNEQPAPPVRADRVAYLKINRNRIMLFEITGLPTDEEMVEYLNRNKPMHSDGRMTAAYFFSKGSRIPYGITSARSIAQANEILYNSTNIDPWEFAYMHSFKGDKEFVSCVTNQQHFLCKK